MSEPPTVAEAIERVTIWRPEEVTIVDQLSGLTNRSFRVRVAGSDFALRLDDAHTERFGLDRQREVSILKAAAAAGLAPEVTFADEGILVTRWIHGRPWTASDLSDDARIETIASLLRRVHDLPPSGEVLDPASVGARYFESASGLPGAADTARVHLTTVESFSTPSEARLCHNDVIAANIVGDEAACLLDWEYACDNDPLYDLACLIEYHGLAERQADRLLGAYAGSNAPDLGERLGGQRRLYVALQHLWFAARDAEAEGPRP